MSRKRHKKRTEKTKKLSVLPVTSSSNWYKASPQEPKKAQKQTFINKVRHQYYFKKLDYINRFYRAFRDINNETLKSFSKIIKKSIK